MCWGSVLLKRRWGLWSSESKQSLFLGPQPLVYGSTWVCLDLKLIKTLDVSDSEVHVLHIILLLLGKLLLIGRCEVERVTIGKASRNQRTLNLWVEDLHFWRQQNVSMHMGI